MAHKRRQLVSLKNSRVVETRMSADGQQIRRRRECLNSGRRFTTVESILGDGLLVIKRDGRREPFDRAKVIEGLRRATEKRPIEAEQIEMLINDVMVSLEEKHNGEIPAHEIGREIMSRLRQIDHIAYVRFACVYKDFRDIEELQKELRSLKRQHKRGQ